VDKNSRQNNINENVFVQLEDRYSDDLLYLLSLNKQNCRAFGIGRDQKGGVNVKSRRTGNLDQGQLNARVEKVK
jgi:hypothetical protein